MRPLTNPIRNYAWGSRTAIASLQRRPAPSPQPEAEMWMGAHPSDPSLLARDGAGTEALTDVIERGAASVLGDSVVDRFGNRLPYLLKVLAAAQPLSLQVHPDAGQARAGFAAEESAGPARGAGERNYVDAHHKPELLVAVGEFEALCGFRDPEATAILLRSLAVAALDPVIAALESGSIESRLRTAVDLVTRWPPADRGRLVAAVAEAGEGLARWAHGSPYRLAATLGRQYPGDVGVVIALMLNHVRLLPDEGVFMPAGNLHAYIAGVGIEIMAASDNVIRGGLTSKHIDVAELLRVLRYEVMDDPVVAPRSVAPGVLGWAAPVSEFALVKATISADTGAVRLPGVGPRIAVCVRGTAALSAGDEVRILRSGESVFVPASEPSIEVTGEGAVFQASPNISANPDIRGIDGQLRPGLSG